MYIADPDAPARTGHRARRRAPDRAHRRLYKRSAAESFLTSIRRLRKNGTKYSMALAGDFKEITFSDVVQLYSLTKRTAMLVLNSPASGQPMGFFYFEGGELFDAKLGDAEGLEAVYRALQLKEGTFHVVP